MNDKVYAAVIILVAVVRLLLCWKAKRRITKWIPTLLIVSLMIACVAAYALSGGTNWAFLILILMLVPLLAADGTTWVFYATIRSISKRAGKGR